MRSYTKSQPFIKTSMPVHGMIIFLSQYLRVVIGMNLLFDIQGQYYACIYFMPLVRVSTANDFIVDPVVSQYRA